MAIESYYTTLTLLTKSQTTNAKGAAVDAWAESSFQGAINQLNSYEIELSGRLGIEADYKLYCPTSVSITGAHRIKYGGKTYRMVSEPKNTMRRGHHYKILLKRVSDENS